MRTEGTLILGKERHMGQHAGINQRANTGYSPPFL